MKKFSLTLALSLSLTVSFAFAGKPVCKEGKLFLKDGGSFYPAVYEGSGAIRFYDKDGNLKEITEFESSDVLVFRTCSEVKQKSKSIKQKHNKK